MPNKWIRVALCAALTLAASLAGVASASANGEQFIYVHNNSPAPGAPGVVIGARMDNEGRYSRPFSIEVPAGQITFFNDTQSMDISARFRMLVLSTGTSLTTIRLNRDGRFASKSTFFPAGATALTGVHILENRTRTFVYATDSGSPIGVSDVRAFQVAPNGALVSLGVFSTGAAGPSIGLTEVGNFLVVVNRAGGLADTLTLFRINTNTGGLGLPVVSSGLAGCNVVFAAGPNVYYPNCEGGTGGVTVLRPNQAGQLSVVGKAATKSLFINSASVRPRVLVAASVVPDAVLQSFLLSNAGLPANSNKALEAVADFPGAGYGIARFAAPVQGRQFLVVAGNGAGGPGTGPGEIRTFRANLANAVLSPVLPTSRGGVVTKGAIQLPGPNNFTGMALFSP
jgi:hypothetical protein